jgi:hypothetical protein
MAFFSKPGGKPTRSRLNVFMDETVFPLLYDRLDEVFPEFSFVKNGDHWEATVCPDALPEMLGTPRPDRIYCYQNAPWMFHIQGGESMSWYIYANKGNPLTGVFPEVCQYLAGKVNVKLPDFGMSPEERQQATDWENRRHALKLTFGACAFWLHALEGQEARDYMVQTRGFTLEQLKGLQAGLYPPLDRLENVLAFGKLADVGREQRVLDRRMKGYVVFPWFEPNGAPMTLCGRWPNKTLPLQRNHPGWKRNRAKLLKEWGAKSAAEKQAKPWVEPTIPKIFTLMGAGTKGSPLFFDRALKAGVHGHLIGVEGVTDAAMLQAHGMLQAVAYVGSSFSEEQIKTLVRYKVRYVTVVPDPDGGGERGCLRSIKKLRAAGITVYVVQLPSGQDPDEFVIANGIDAFRKLVENPQPGCQYEVHRLFQGADKSSPEPKRHEARNRTLRFAATLKDSSERDAVLKIIARELGYALRDLREDFTGFKKENKKQEKAQATKTGSKKGSEEDTGIYIIADGCYARETGSAFAPKTILLSNCTIWVAKEITEKDGVEERKGYVLEGKLASGAALPPVKIPPAVFDAMNWVSSAWGSAVIIEAGMGSKDHLRAAILHHSHPTHSTIYSHTGWVKHGNERYYLHAGGVIGPGGSLSSVSVNLEGTLRNFVLPEPPTGPELAEAVRKSLGLLNGLGPDRVMFPLRMTGVHAPLPGGDFSTHLVGKTGSFKSELAALEQQHWGATMTRLNLPANWSSTDNLLETQAFYAKDALLVVDDFKPKGSAYDIAQYHRKAERLFRAVANRSGRGRLKRDSTPIPEKPPRGIILSTGEELPRGQSLQARLVTPEVSRAEINISRLTECQRDAAAGIYAAANAGWIQWFARDYDRFTAELVTLRESIRDELLGNAAWHAQAPTITADLLAGWTLYLRFAVDCGAIDQAESDSLMKRARAALLELAHKQAGYQADADPCYRYLDLLRSVLSSGRGHVATREGGAPQPNSAPWGWREDGLPLGKQIGWVDGPDLYLDASAAYAEANALASLHNEPFDIAPATLNKQLKDEGLLASIDNDGRHLLVRRSVEGQIRRVLHLLTATLIQLDDTPPTQPPKSPPDPGGQGSDDGFLERALAPDDPIDPNQPSDHPTTGEDHGQLPTAHMPTPDYAREPASEHFLRAENSVGQETFENTDLHQNLSASTENISANSENLDASTEKHDKLSPSLGGAQKAFESGLSSVVPSGQCGQWAVTAPDAPRAHAHAREARTTRTLHLRTLHRMHPPLLLFPPIHPSNLHLVSPEPLMHGGRHTFAAGAKVS